ncbi:MAG: hypothetical protein VKO21_07815 [Candidatus Sericytochromatia bacterium]|nr:hypothetical protein [Candidatus Sericytochromatia bacterium]
MALNMNLINNHLSRQAGHPLSRLLSSRFCSSVGVRTITAFSVLLCALLVAGCRNPWYLIAQPARLWVAVPSQRRLFELDREGLRTTLGQVFLEASPARLAWSPMMRQVVALMPEARSAAIIDPGLLRVVQTVGVGGTPVDVGVPEGASSAHVLLADDRAVAVIDLRTGRVRRVALSPTGGKPAVLACPRNGQDESWILAEDGRIEVVRDGMLQQPGVPIPGIQRPVRMVPDRQIGVAVLDAARSTLVRLNAARGDAATSVGIGSVTGGGLPADLAIAPDGKVGITFPDAGRLVVMEPDGRSQAYVSGASGARALVADARGFHVAHEGPNQVFSLTWSGTTLLAARWVDTLPGPPVALATLD